MKFRTRPIVKVGWIGEIYAPRWSFHGIVKILDTSLNSTFWCEILETKEKNRSSSWYSGMTIFLEKGLFK